jgi:hypothetical protein
MTLSAQASDQLAALARTLNLESLTLDDQGLRALAVGDHPAVHLQADSASQEFVLFAVAGTLPPSPPAQQLAQLLQANRFWRETGGATLSLDDEQPPRVILARRVSWVACTPAEFVEAFATFIDYLADWNARLQLGAVPGIEPPRMSYA